jgi:ribosomal protein S18 acetylase RimI-like enzyme
MTNNVSIRICKPGDENTLSLLGQATFLESFAGQLDGSDILGHCAVQHSTAVYRKWLKQPDTKIWLAEIEPGGAPIGYMVLVPRQDRNDYFEIKRLYLLQRFQRAGAGKQLMQEALAHVKKKNCRGVLLEVYSGNTGAMAFYQKFGFVTAGKRSFRVISNNYEHTTMELTFQPPG